MTVLAQRDCNITMAQQLLNDLNVYPHNQQYRCNVALARTLTVLPQLDGQRKGSLIHFLSVSKLVEIINLSDADLSRTDPRRADLSRANLNHAKLSNANLSDANMNRISLRDANLSKTIITTEQINSVRVKLA